MSRSPNFVDELRARLLRELLEDVDQRFDGNKAKAAEASGVHRVPFTNICNGREAATIDKFMQIGMRLGWKFDVRISKGRRKHSDSEVD